MAFLLLFQRKHPEIRNSLTKTEQDDSSHQQPSMFSFLATSKKFLGTDTRQEKLNDFLIMFISGNLLSLSIVDSPEFRLFIEELNPRYQVPSRKYLTTKLLQQKTDEVYAAVKTQLKQAQEVCLTLDLWSSRQMHSYLGMTAHYILDWALKSVMVTYKRFKGRHTSDNIHQMYDETVACFDITKKISTITTDDASNMVKAFSLPFFSSSVKSPDEDTASKDESEDDDDLTTGALEEDEIEHLSEHLPCFTHTLQLVISDGFKQAGPINKVLAKARKIVSDVRTSTHGSDILGGKNRLQANNVTRWNSQMKMIRSILSIPEDKLDQLQTEKLTKYDRSILEDLCKMLVPFEEATDLAQQSNGVSASYVILCVLGLKAHLMAMSLNYNCKFLSTLKSSVEKRLSVYLEREEFQLAAMLDPRFKLQWCTTSDQEASKKTLLLQHFHLKKDQSTSTATESDCVPPPKTKSRILSFMGSAMSATPRKADNESLTYLGEPCITEDQYPLAWWKTQQTTYPTLAKMASYYLAIPASSAAVERIFTIAGKIFRPDSTFEKLMFLKCNQHIGK